MFITSLQVTNYKSFLFSGEIKFTRGFNIIVGRNNAGKTALIEALGLQFPDNPHRSLATVPTPLSVIGKKSSVNITFGVEPAEALETFDQLKVLMIPVREHEHWALAEDRFRKFIASEFEISGVYQHSGFSEPKMIRYEIMESHNVGCLEYFPEGKTIGAPKRGTGNARTLTQFTLKILTAFRDRIYVFRAERLNLGECALCLDTVLAADARNLAENNETKAETVNVIETNELRAFLSDVGARLSDVFGADTILWVEGRTEEICFRLIVERLLKIELLGTDIIGVKQVGDLEGRHAKTVLEIYKRLCQGRGLLPPALGFCFDQEGRSASDQADLSANSGGMIKFIPRRMYENYLLNPKAIAAVLSKADQQRSTPVTEREVNEWLNKKGQSKPYVSAKQRGEWVKIVDAARLLNDLFSDLTETRVCFDKTSHGVKLTEWLIENETSHLMELANFLKAILTQQTKVS